MFKLASVASFTRTVTVHVPDEKVADQLNPQPLKVRFRVLDKTEAEAFDASRRALPIEEQLADPHALLKLVVIGWEDVVDDDKTPVPFSPEALRQALNLPWFPMPVLEEYRRGLNGQPRLGN